MEKFVIDGGVQRGSDVLKAIALGADAVAIGKLWAWGQGAAGTAVIAEAIDKVGYKMPKGGMR